MKVLMVCLGNICRSPLAEGILEQELSRNGIEGWQVDSAGTAHWHVGKAPDPRSIAVARKNGLDISEQRARQFKAGDFNAYDRIFVMDASNYSDVTNLARTELEKDKVQLIMALVDPDNPTNVPDPYWGDDGFDFVYDMLLKACRVLIS